jgi:hypothetical protein
MWLFGDRHTPLSPRYIYYSDMRPILPQDGTRGYLWFRKLDDPYRLLYLRYYIGKQFKYLLSTNLPTAEREKIYAFQSYYPIFLKNLNLFLVIPTIFFSGAFIKSTQTNLQPYVKASIFVWIYFSLKMFSESYLNDTFTNVFTYNYWKYSHTAVDELKDIKDKRREFFRPDTKSYYRETPQEIMDKKGHHLLHDSSIYYGPHPFDDHENAENLVELNKKFMTGKAKFDDPHNELLLNEPIDIERRIRSIPTFEEYKKI